MKYLFLCLLSVFSILYISAEPGNKILLYSNSSESKASANIKNPNVLPPVYLAQLSPTIQLQGNAVPPEEGKTETEKVRPSKAIWIALIAIFIAVYVAKRRKKNEEK